MTRTNGQWVLASRPEGMIAESNFEYKVEPVREIEDGEVLVRNLYLAFEPAMRGWVDDVPSYIPPVAIGEYVYGQRRARIESNAGGPLGEGLQILDPQGALWPAMRSLKRRQRLVGVVCRQQDQLRGCAALPQPLLKL